MANVPADPTTYNQVMTQNLGAKEMEIVGLTARILTCEKVIDEQADTLASQSEIITSLRQQLTESQDEIAQMNAVEESQSGEQLNESEKAEGGNDEQRD